MSENNLNDMATSITYELKYINLPAIIISVFGVVLNVLLLVAFVKDPLKCFRNSGTYLVINLSVSDFLMCLFAPFSVTTKARIGGYSIFRILVFCFGSSSFLSMASISIDRLLMVIYPIKYRILIQSKAIAMWIASIWTVASVALLPRLFYNHAMNKNVGIYLIGAIVVSSSAVMYICTYYKLKKQSRNIALLNSNESRAQKMRIIKERKFLKTIIIIACMAFFCTVPPLAFLQTHHFLGLKNDMAAFSILQNIFLFIFFANFAANPLIYVVRLRNYRKTFDLLYYRRTACYHS